MSQRMYGRTKVPWEETRGEGGGKARGSVKVGSCVHIIHIRPLGLLGN